MINADKATQTPVGRKINLTRAAGFNGSDIGEELLGLCAKVVAPNVAVAMRDFPPTRLYGDPQHAVCPGIRAAPITELGWRPSIYFHEQDSRGSKPGRFRSRRTDPLVRLHSKDFMNANRLRAAMATVENQAYKAASNIQLTINDFAYNMLELTNRNDILIKYLPPSDGHIMNFDISNLQVRNDANANSISITRKRWSSPCAIFLKLD